MGPTAACTKRRARSYDQDRQHIDLIFTAMVRNTEAVLHWRVRTNTAQHHHSLPERHPQPNLDVAGFSAPESGSTPSDKSNRPGERCCRSRNLWTKSKRVGEHPLAELLPALLSAPGVAGGGQKP